VAAHLQQQQLAQMQAWTAASAPTRPPLPALQCGGGGGSLPTTAGTLTGTAQAVHSVEAGPSVTMGLSSATVEPPSPGMLLDSGVHGAAAAWDLSARQRPDAGGSGDGDGGGAVEGH
jgi:hypothetical protein